jgi:uncharacterized SAM-binding protein YcdF (DUF218 family)
VTYEYFNLFIEPVALVAWLFLFLLIVLFRSGHRPVFYFGLFVFLVYAWCASPFGANVMVGGLEHRAIANATDCGDSLPTRIVVLAGGKAGAAASRDDYELLKEAAFRRTVEAVKLAGRSPQGTLVISGGSRQRVTEADLMQSFAQALGFSANRITTERESLTTHESAVAVSQLLPAPQRKITLVTSALHMPRAAAVFVKQGFSVCAYPVDRRWVDAVWTDMFIPQISALTKSSEAFHELLGLVWYWLSGKT